MAKLLAVPFRSQSGPDAQFATTDCGAACVAMLLEGFGSVVKIDDIFKSTNRPHNVFLSRSDLINAAGDFNLSLTKFNNGSQNFLKQSIDANRPFIALVNYKAWSDPGSGVSVQVKFKSAHFVVVTGYDGDDVFINDPLFTPDREKDGKNKRMTYAQFASAWGTAHTFPGNPDFAGLITVDKLPGLAQPVTPPVSQEQINRILAWAFIAGFNVTPATLASPEVAAVFLKFMGNWGNNVVEHVIQEGDDLGKLALRYYGDPLKWKVITLFNGLPPLNAFETGDVLKIPEPTSH